ncbi:MAG: methylmalonyl-CoA mutase family protein [Candidatus Dormibacteria bacterium]
MALERLQEAARGSENLMPRILDSCRALATEGEIIAALQEVFGTYRESPSF